MRLSICIEVASITVTCSSFVSESDERIFVRIFLPVLRIIGAPSLVERLVIFAVSMTAVIVLKRALIGVVSIVFTFPITCVDPELLSERL